ncbi:anti-sigma factor [Glaciimonas sp. GS1]|uniref:Anti-sigma factor n=2 Tax=Glaciimonas soli TaxID=2590999 RepID=A0A843YHE4_9BURK|nr:anti-sigma factor [Glaciimonas soli]
MMNHQQALELIPAYVDQELSVSETIELARHLDSCSSCQQEYAQQNQVSDFIKKQAPYHQASASLAQRINAALPGAQSEPATTHAQPNKADRSGWRVYKLFNLNFNWINAGAVLTTLLAVIWSAGLYLNLPSAQDRLADEVVASHVRSLQVNHLSDVISTDKHTVKPWFNGKINFSPTVIDLAQQGYPLAGGRLDYLDGHPVAALIYHRQLHPINVYIWPDNVRDAAPKSLSERGYHLMHWTSKGMVYWVASDVAAPELANFVTLLREQISSAE